MTPLIALGVTATVSVWCVCEANRAFARMNTCRYRDFRKLSRQASNYTAAYMVAGAVLPFIHPAGLLASLGVYGYAVYRRQSA